MGKRRKKGNSAAWRMLPVLVILLFFGGLWVWETGSFPTEEAGAEVRPTKTVTRNGKDYFPRQDITVFLLLGIDEAGPVRGSGSYNNTGEADVILLAVADETAQALRILALNRDTMAQVPMLGLGGKFAGFHEEQLALAHTYGSGLEDSCENTRNAVSSLLNSIRIDHYLAVRMDAVAILNDAVGGVTVNVTKELHEADPSLPRGEQRLTGAQALQFVQVRRGVGNQLNPERMQRQQLYMEGLMTAWQSASAQDGELGLKIYEKVAPYLVTDCSAELLRGFTRRFGGYALQEIVTPEGETVLEGQYYAFYPETDKLEELILRLFYAPKNF